MSVFLLFPRLYVRVFTVPQVICEGLYCSPGYMWGFLLFPRLYVRVFTFCSHVESTCMAIISLRGEVWARKTSLTLPLFIEVPVPSQGYERWCKCVLVVSIWPLATIFLLDFETVPTVWYFWLILELFPQCGIFFSIGFWNCSHCVIFFVWFWNCSDSVVLFFFSIFWNCSDSDSVVFFLFF